MKSKIKVLCACKPLLMVLVLTACSLTTLLGQNKNIVIFIGDGMGFEHVRAARLYRNGTDATPLAFETLNYQGSAITKLPNGTVTDSATAGTALATGY